jgi:hypothetical protein
MCAVAQSMAGKQNPTDLDTNVYDLIDPGWLMINEQHLTEVQGFRFNPQWMFARSVVPSPELFSKLLNETDLWINCNNVQCCGIAHFRFVKKGTPLPARESSSNIPAQNTKLLSPQARRRQRK